MGHVLKFSNLPPSAQQAATADIVTQVCVYRLPADRQTLKGTTYLSVKVCHQLIEICCIASIHVVLHLSFQ